MEQDTLMLEIGEGPISELTSGELDAILTKYTDDQVLLAAMKTFDLLRKKYQPNYKMGKMYEDLGDKYKYYDGLFNQYARSVGAGKVADSTIERQDLGKFREN